MGPNHRWLRLLYFGLALPLTASEKAVDFMCQCDFTDNSWMHDFTSMLIHIQDLPKTLSNNEDASTQWILQQTCAEDATTYPNSQRAFDLNEILQLQEGEATVHNSCLPGYLAMSMVCAQQWIAKKSLMGVVKWVTKMNELVPVVNVCMDQYSPVPFQLNDFTTYMERFSGGVPPPQHPAFVQTLAWPTKAVAKQPPEAAKAMLECLPLKDPSCFPRSTTNPFESCAECCSPKHGPLGQERCWQDGFDFQRCCNAAAPTGGSSGSDSAALKKSLDEAAKKSAELEQQLKLHKDNLKSCEDEKEAKVKELQSQTELVKGLQEASKGGAAQDAAELATLKAEKEKLQKAAADAAEVPALKKSLEDVQGQLKASEAKVKELTELKAKAEKSDTSELEKLRADIQKKEAEKAAEMKKKDAELQAKTAEMEKQKSAMKKQEEEFEKKEAAMAKLEASMNTREKEASAAALKSEAELKKRLDGVLKQKEVEIQQLQGQLQEAQSKSAKQGKPEAELQKFKEELQKSQQKTQQDAQELTKLRAELDQLKGAQGKEQNAETEKMKAEIAKVSEKSKKDLAELQKQFEASQKKLQDAETSAAQQQKKLTELEIKGKERDAELQRLREEAKAKQLQKEVCQAHTATPKELQQQLTDLLGVGPT